MTEVQNVLEQLRSSTLAAETAATRAALVEWATNTERSLVDGAETHRSAMATAQAELAEKVRPFVSLG